jgi:hypothetical protein
MTHPPCARPRTHLQVRLHGGLVVAHGHLPVGRHLRSRRRRVQPVPAHAQARIARAHGPAKRRGQAAARVVHPRLHAWPAARRPCHRATAQAQLREVDSAGVGVAPAAAARVGAGAIGPRGVGQVGLRHARRGVVRDVAGGVLHDGLRAEACGGGGGGREAAGPREAAAEGRAAAAAGGGAGAGIEGREVREEGLREGAGVAHDQRRTSRGGRRVMRASVRGPGSWVRREGRRRRRRRSSCPAMQSGGPQARCSTAPARSVPGTAAAPPPRPPPSAQSSAGRVAHDPGRRLRCRPCRPRCPGRSPAQQQPHITRQAATTRVPARAPGPAASSAPPPTRRCLRKHARLPLASPSHTPRLFPSALPGGAAW